MFRVNYVTIKKFAELSGYTEKAVREKIRQGIWPEGTICHHAPDGRLLISLTEYEQWVETGAALKRHQKAQLKSRLYIKKSAVESGLNCSPPPLI